jgi:hypothetical protein
MEAAKVSNTVGRRPSDRILTPIRIRVTGKDTKGITFTEETVTVSISQRGASISLTHSLLPDGIVLITNLENLIEEEFRVVGALHHVFGGRQEWDVEAIREASEVWGRMFATPAEGIEPKVPVECVACKTPAHSTLSSIDYEVLLSTGLICRHCDRCGETTRWKPSAQAIPPEVATLIARKTGSGASERRKARRLPLTMCIRVRNARGVSDIAQTRDVSKTGVCFVSRQVFQFSEQVYITRPFTDQRIPLETKAKIIWCEESPAGRFYGVSYLS